MTGRFKHYTTKTWIYLQMLTVSQLWGSPYRQTRANFFIATLWKQQTRKRNWLVETTSKSMGVGGISMVTVMVGLLALGIGSIGDGSSSTLWIHSWASGISMRLKEWECLRGQTLGGLSMVGGTSSRKRIRSSSSSSSSIGMATSHSRSLTFCRRRHRFRGGQGPCGSSHGWGELSFMSKCERGWA